MAFFEKLKKGLSKTRNAVFGQVENIFRSFSRVDEDLYDELEETLIMADVGVDTTEYIIEELRKNVKEKHLHETDEVKEELREILSGLVGEGGELDLSGAPAVILIIGVNGVGKTTSIGKIAHHLKNEGKKVVVVAADTFRAAAIEQLGVWCDRAGVELIKQNEGADPAAVVFDGIAAARKRKADVILVDTAGRLHNKHNLMDELGKIDRVISRELPDSSRETLLVIDSTTGQNAIVQAKEFKNICNISGLILTKLDGSAKGGAVFAIKREIDLPVKYIGVGEQIDDMEPFDSAMFVDAMLGE